MFGALDTTQIIYLLVALIISIVIHELMHGVVAYWLGDRTAADAGRLTINPLASVDPIGTILIPFVAIVFFNALFLAAKPVPFNPDRVKWDEYGAALVALAGPASNFLLALVGAGVYAITAVGTPLHTFAAVFAGINVAIMIFNLIPFPPLDGSRVLYAFAPDPVREVMERIEASGMIALLIIFFVAIYVLSPIIGDLQQTILQFIGVNGL
jgi:Zn-dependent protease